MVDRIDEERDGIESVRSMLPQCWIDEENCGGLVDGLDHYRKEWDDKHATFKNRPLHNWASHAGSAFKILAQGFAPAMGYSQSDVAPEEEAAF